MPLIKTQYSAPWYLPGGMLQTIVAGRMKREELNYVRTTLELNDGDFLDLDWKTNQNDRLIIMTHGLEGSSRSQYVADLYHQLDDDVFDLLAWNCRSCSGRMNRLKRLYHHGEIEDIAEVIEHVLSLGRYKEIYLVGISMGGNISTKFLAKNKALAKHISKCAIVSTPCDLAAASRAMDAPKNAILRTYFMRNLHKKFTAKEEQFPSSFPMDRFYKMKTWNQFDSEFVAPFIGFASADEFYYEASANNYIEDVEVDLFLINAKNDPVLAASCHPIEKAKKMSNFHFEYTKTGGHAYFPMKNINYSVKRLLEFFG